MSLRTGDDPLQSFHDSLRGFDDWLANGNIRLGFTRFRYCPMLDLYVLAANQVSLRRTLSVPIRISSTPIRILYWSAFGFFDKVGGI